jgi:hypothetical protein
VEEEREGERAESLAAIDTKTRGGEKKAKYDDEMASNLAVCLLLIQSCTKRMRRQLEGEEGRRGDSSEIIFISSSDSKGKHSRANNKVRLRRNFHRARQHHRRLFFSSLQLEVNYFHPPRLRPLRITFHGASLVFATKTFNFILILLRVAHVHRKLFAGLFGFATPRD